MSERLCIVSNVMLKTFFFPLALPQRTSNPSTSTQQYEQGSIPTAGCPLHIFSLAEVKRPPATLHKDFFALRASRIPLLKHKFAWGRRCGQLGKSELPSTRSRPWLVRVY